MSEYFQVRFQHRQVNYFLTATNVYNNVRTEILEMGVARGRGCVNSTDPSLDLIFV